MLQQQDRPALCKLRQELELHPGPADILDNPTWTIHDPVSGQFFRIGWKEFEILNRWHLGDAVKIIKLTNSQTTLNIFEKDIAELDKFLCLNFLCTAELKDFSRHQQASSMKAMSLSKAMKSYLFFKIPLCRPDNFLEWVHPVFTFFFTRTFVLLMFFLSLLSLGLIIRQWDSFTSSFTSFFNLEGILVYGVVIIFSKIMHEFAHAITAKHYGVRVTTLGVALMVLWPLLYTDTSDSWKIADKYKRISIAGAGIVSELALASLAGLFWVILDDGPWRSACFLLASTNWITTLLFNMNPFMRYDGYFIVSDYLNMENLQTRAFAYTGWRISEALFKFGDPPPEKIPRKLEKILIIYSVSTWLYRILIISSIAILVYHLLFKALGILLLISQLYQSVLKPLSQKTAKIIARKKEIKPLKSNLAASFFIFILLVLFFLPISHDIKIQGVLDAGDRTLIHTTEAGLMENVPFVNGEAVTRGDMLFSIFSPNIEQELESTRLRITRYKKELASHNFDVHRKEHRLVLLAELERERSKYSSLEKKKQKLIITAPIDGELELPEEAFKQGEWVGAGGYLGTVVNLSSQEIIAYVEELDVHRIKQETIAVFYPYLAEQPPIKARLKLIEKHAATELSDPSFASINGGSIAVTTTDRRLLPLHTYYKVALSPVDALPARALPFSLEGTLVIKAQRRSLAERFFKKVMGLLIRESVF